MNNPYSYYAKVRKVVDSHTVELNIDLGFDTWKAMKCKLHGIRQHTEANKELKAKVWLMDQLWALSEILVVTHRFEKSDEYEVELFLGEVCINDEMQNCGHALSI